MTDYTLARDLGGQYGKSGDTYPTDDEAWAASMIVAGHFAEPKGKTKTKSED